MTGEPCYCLGENGSGTMVVAATCTGGSLQLPNSCTCACPPGEIFNDGTGQCEVPPQPPPPPGVDPSCPATGNWTLVTTQSPCECFGSYDPGNQSETFVVATCPAGLYYVEELCRCTCLGKAFDNSTNTCVDAVVCPGPESREEISSKAPKGSSSKAPKGSSSKAPKGSSFKAPTSSSKAPKGRKS